jgi:hypothetical protein
VRRGARRGVPGVIRNAPQKAFAIYAQKSRETPVFCRKPMRFSDFSRFSTDTLVSCESRTIEHIIRLIRLTDARRAG